jgi:hypothetical protein
MSQLVTSVTEGAEPTREFAELTAKVSMPFGSRASDLHLDAEFRVNHKDLPDPYVGFEEIDRLRGSLSSSAIKYVQEYFRSVTGGDQYFDAHVKQLLGWVVTELTANELYHGVLGLSSKDKFALTAEAAMIKELYGSDVDPESKRFEIQELLFERIKENGPHRPLSLSIRTGTDGEGRPYFEVSVGAPREFDLEKARQAARDESALIDRLFEQGKTDEATQLLEKRWGRGLWFMGEKINAPGDSLRQDPPVTGPVIFRKQLPDS